jgi:hypothetical protein
MEEDKRALDRLYTDVLEQYPPGEQREVALNQLLRMAAFTRCPDWQPCRRKPPRFTLVKSG